MFGSKPAARVFAHSHGPLAAVAPAGTGVVDVTVTTPGGTSAIGPSDRFSYQPTVTDVRADYGRPAGGSVVTIVGANFARVSAVSFGSNPAKRFVVESPSTIRAVAPAGTGTVHVTVSAPGGTSAAGTGDLFAYAIRGQFATTATPELGSSGHLNGISCISLGVCVAVGHAGIPGGEALIEGWNGTGWSTVSAPPTPKSERNHEIVDAQLSGVSCTSASFCVAVGGLVDKTPTFDSTGPFPFIDAWNGVAWSQASVPVGDQDAQSELHGVSCVSSSFCMAVGARYAPIGKGLLGTFVEHWNGETWSRVESPEGEPGGEAEGELEGASCVSTTFCVAVGRTYRGGGATIESWNGTAWSVVPGPDLGTSESVLDGVSCTSVKRCVAVGFDEHGALAEFWDGSNWSVHATPTLAGSSALLGVSCDSRNSCTAVGGDETQGEVQTLVAGSTGSTWSTIQSPTITGGNALLSGISCVHSQWGPACFSVGEAEVAANGPVQPLAEDGRL